MIYLLEDDESIRKLVIYALESQGFEARGFSLPSLFWEEINTEGAPDLVLLDIMLPEEDGISILKKLRNAKPSLPVIMLTARNSEFDRVEGLNAGADDYISKPFGMMELIARIRAVLRRSARNSESTSRAEEGGCNDIRTGVLYICPDHHEVTVAGEEVRLTYKEFLLLQFLAENEGRVLTRDTLLEEVWGLGTDRENRTLDVHIRSLRSKLGEAGRYIETIRSVGYRLSGDLHD